MFFMIYSGKIGGNLELIMSEKEEKKMSIRDWIQHGEWLGLMITLISCFLYVHHENVHIGQRLDNHMEAINRRADDLHKEFYSLLKVMNDRSLE